jgi:hypothetical protein
LGTWNVWKKGGRGKKKRKKREKKAFQGSIFFGGENLPKCKKKRGGLMKALLEKKMDLKKKNAPYFDLNEEKNKKI